MKHAVLSASSSQKWLNCPACIELERNFSNVSSPYAYEGTLAHELAEIFIKLTIKMISEQDFNVQSKIIEEKVSKFYKLNKEFGDFEEKMSEMIEYVQLFADYVEKIYKSYEDNKVQVFVEQRLDYGDFAKGGFGTGDVVIVSDDTIHIIDFKYGQNIRVFAENNTQLMLYGLGALTRFDRSLEIENINFAIMQPRLNHISEWSMSTVELYSFGIKTVKPKSELALKNGNSPIAGSHCVNGFCRAKQTCRAFADRHLELEKYEFKNPNLLEDEEIADILNRIETLKNWVSGIKSFAIESMQKGADIQGFKLGTGRTKRIFSDNDKVIKVLETLGLSKEDYLDIKLKSVAFFEKKLGAEFDILLGELVLKSKGKPTIINLSKSKDTKKTSNEDDFADFDYEKTTVEDDFADFDYEKTTVEDDFEGFDY